MKDNNVFPTLSLKEWIEKFNTLENSLKTETIKRYYQKYKNNQLELYAFFYKRQNNKILNQTNHYSYVEKYYEEKNKWERGGTLSFRSKRLIEILSWERDISKNLYLKIVDKQEEVEKFILGDIESENNGRFIYIKRATNDSFYDFIIYVNNFVDEYIKLKDLKENPIFKKNLKGRSTNEKEKNLNATIDFINEFLYLQDKNRKKIDQINLKDFRDLKKELLCNIDKLDIEFCNYPNNLTSLINNIVEIIEAESEFINEQMELEKSIKGGTFK